MFSRCFNLKKKSTDQHPTTQKGAGPHCLTADKTAEVLNL